MDWMTWSAIIIAVISFAIIMRRSHTGTPEQASDLTALEMAEKEVQRSTADGVPIGHFYTQQGFDDSKVLDLVSFLNTNGVRATYSAEFSYHTRSFTLKVPKNQSGEGRSLVEQYFKTKARSSSEDPGH